MLKMHNRFSKNYNSPNINYFFKNLKDKLSIQFGKLADNSSFHSSLPAKFIMLYNMYIQFTL